MWSKLKGPRKLSETKKERTAGGAKRAKENKKDKKAKEATKAQTT